MGEQRSSLLDWFSSRLNLTEIFSLLTSYGIFYGELDSRKPLREALVEARQEAVPSYSRWPRILGLIAVVMIGLQLLSGGLLALYYLPTLEAAYSSVGTILREVHFGRFVHQIHFWGAQLLILVLMLRVIRFFVGGVHRPPRELIWVFAVLLLLVAFHLDLTGRALPMTASGYWSSVRALEIVGAVPIYGPIIHFLIGGHGALITELTLIRFYVLHVAALPLLAITLIYLHFSSIRRVGLSDRESDREIQTPTVVRRHLANMAIVLTLVLGLLVTLAVLVPLPFERQADPFTTPPGIGPPWYLLAVFGFLEWAPDAIPQWLAGSLLFLGFMSLLGLPLMTRLPAGPTGQRVTLAVGLLVMAVWLALTIYGARVA